MAVTRFIRLNIDWNAEPNVPSPEVSTDGLKLELRLLVTAPSRRDEVSQAIKLTFADCSRWRLSDVNDEGWYLGQCRYGRSAPAWGHFYEIAGENALRDQPDDWQQTQQPGQGDRHFLFYLRDETFECTAGDWTMDAIQARAHISHQSPAGLTGIDGVEYLG
jgi:hypothetical protein